MREIASLKSLAVALTALTALTLSASSAWAQASVDYKGSLDVGIDYLFTGSSKVVVNSNISVGGNSVQTHTTMFKASYVPIERLAVDLMVPLTLVKYTGDMVHTPLPGKWDDKKIHPALTDLELGARYALLEAPLLVTPKVTFVVPLSNYPTNGFSAPGRHLKQVRLGAALGRTIDPISPNLFFEVAYDFTLSEKYDEAPTTNQITQNRSDFSAVLGYAFLESRLFVDLAANYRMSHGGIDFEKFDTYTMEQQNLHDALLDEDFLYLGGDVSYAITDKLYVGALVRLFATGSNTHDSKLFGLSVGYSVL